GAIDEVFVSTQNISKDALAALACIGRPSGMVVTPLASAPTPPDTNTSFTVTVTDNDLGACQPKTYDMFINSFEPGINTSFDPPGQFQSALPGQTLTFTVEVSGTEDADPGSHDIQF